MSVHRTPYNFARNRARIHDEQHALTHRAGQNPENLSSLPATYSAADEERPTRLPSSVRRYYPGSWIRQTTQDHSTVHVSHRRASLPWLLPVGVGMVLMVGLWTAGAILVNRWRVLQDDWTYGRSRTYQTEVNVGHGKASSHFIAVNLNRQVEVIEIPEGDPGHAKLYVGPTLTGDGQDLAPVTLDFKDVNGDHKPDMIIKVGTSRFVFLNTGNAFRPKQSDDQANR